MTVSFISCTETTDTDDSSNNLPADQTSSDKKDAKKTYGKNEVVETGKIKITLVDKFENTGTDYFKPADGKVFVHFEFTIENNDTEDFAISSLMNFSCYFDDVATTFNIGALSANEDKGQLDGSIAAGKKMNGALSYEAPSDWKKAEIQFKPDILKSDKLIFTVENE